MPAPLAQVGLFCANIRVVVTDDPIVTSRITPAATMPRVLTGCPACPMHWQTREAAR